ncbi:MAG: rhodanese-like domain-containing protein, partial [Actinomycetota bacterium]
VSSAKAPVTMLGYRAETVASGEYDVVEPPEVEGLVAAGWTVLDVRTPAEHAAGAVAGSRNAPLDTLRDDLERLGPGPFLVFCEVGQRGHTATSLLHELGIEARNLDGGWRTWVAHEAARTHDLSLLVPDAQEAASTTVG